MAQTPQLPFPLQFLRQYAGSLDADFEFKTTADRLAYLSSARCYPGQPVFDAELGRPFWVNLAKDGFIELPAAFDPSLVEDKLDVAFVTSLPVTPEEGTLYVNTATQESQLYVDGAYMSLGSAPEQPVSGDPYEFTVPVPIILGFNTDLDTPHHTRLYFPEAIAGITFDYEDSQISGATFTPQLPGSAPDASLNSVAELQVWIDDNVTGTGFFVDVAITPTNGVEGELTATFTYRKPISVPTVTTVSGGTGWARYADTQYTQANPFRLLAGQEMVLPNNAGAVLDEQLPTDVISFYDAASQKITPKAVGDGYNFQIIFKAVPTVANAKLDFGIDIGGTVGAAPRGKIFPINATVNANAGDIDPVLIGIPGAYSLDTFVANGGQVKIIAEQDVDVYDIVYIISRYHRAANRQA